MAESSYPNPAVTQLQHERLVGRAMPSGVLGHPTDTTVVYANGTGTREIRIRADKQAVVRGFGWQNDAAEIVKTVAANTSGSTRTDLVVLRYSRADYSVTVQIVQGTPGSGAPSPTYNTGASGVWELPLATVAVANNAVSIAASAVTRKNWYLGDGGEILCVPGTRPPASMYRSAFETDTGRWILSDGTTWNAPLEDTGVTSVQMLSGFSAPENSLQRRGGVCVLNLKVQRTNAVFAAGATTKVANLPAGFVPTFPVQSAALSWSNAQPAALQVTSSGVYVVTPAGVSVPEDRTVDGSLTWHSA